MILLDGKRIKEEKFVELKKEISSLERRPGIAVIQVGNDSASNVYVKSKEKFGKELGCIFNHIKFDENTSEEDILKKIDELNSDKNIDGILVQMPIPKRLNSSVIQNRIIHNKDIDGLTDINAGLLFHNKDSFIPCTPKGIMEMLKYYNIDISGKHVVIVGRSELVGRPLMSLMLNNNATVSICHSYTHDLKSITSMADILVVAVGKRNIIDSSMVKEDCIVIDVGINRDNGKLCGDVDFESVKDKCSYITPVPGGVGQTTVLSLYQNLLKAYRINN